MSLVGTVRKNKRFLPPTMQVIQREKSSIAFDKDVIDCSYIPKAKKCVVLFSSMHFTGEVGVDPPHKPEIINYYYNTKGGVDNMDGWLV